VSHPEGINLAALWLPVAPSTEGLGRAFENVGKEAKAGFTRGFSADDWGSKAGKEFSSKFISNFTSGLTENSVGHAIAGFTNRLTEQTDAALAASLKGKLPGIYREATRATEELRAAEQNKQAQVRATEDVARATVAARAALVAYREAEKAGKLSTEELTAASLKSVAATNELAQAKVRLREATTAQHRVDLEAIEASKQVGVAHEKATQATESHREAVEEYTAATSSAHTMSGLLGGVMGGALVLGVNAVVEGFEKIAEVGVDMFKESLEGARELTERLLEVGSTFEGLENQIREFSGLTGEAFETANAHVKDIFGSLDVSGRNLGETYAKLATVLHADPGTPALDELARNVTELQGRFENLRSQDISEIFFAFHTPLEETNEDLAFMLQASQDAGMGLGDFAALMAGPVSEAAAGMGFNIRQAALFTEALGKSGIPARQSLMALGNAQAFFNEKNVSFKDGIAELRREMAAYPDQADALSEKVFGKGVKSDIGKQLLDDLSDAANASGPALDVPIGKLQEFYQATQTLETKIEEFKNRLYEAFAPFGTQLTTEVGGALDNLSNWFTNHRSDIAGKIEEWGDKFINLLPTIKQFTASAIDMMGPLLDALAEMGSLLMTAAAGAAAITFHWDDVGPFMSAAANLGSLSGTLGAGQMGGGGPMDKFTGGLKDQINAIDTSTEALDRFKNTLHGAADAMAHPDSGGSAAPDYTSGGGGMPGSGPVGGPGGPAAPGQSPKYGPAMPTHPSAAAPGGAPAAPSGAVQGPPMPPHAPHGANWNAIAQFEGSPPGNWQTNTNNGFYGGLQFQQSTWAQFGGTQYAPTADRATPEQQMTIADKALKAQGPQAWPDTFTNHPELFVPTAHKGMHVQGDPTISGDHVPILAEHGEFVVNKDSYANPKYRQLINFMNGNPKGFKGGGLVGPAFSQVIWTNTETGQNVGENDGQWVGPGTSQPGFYRDDWSGHTGHVHTTVEHDPFTGQIYDQVPAGSNISQGKPGFPDWVYRLGDQYGVMPSTYSGHQEWGGINHGIDWWPKDAVPNMAGAGYSHEDHETLTGFAQAVGQSATGTPSPGGGAGSGVQLTDYHTGGGGAGGAAGGGGSAGGGGMYGGYTPGTPEGSEMYNRNRAVQRSSEHIGQLQAEQTKDTDDLNQARRDLNFQENLAPDLQNHEQIKALNEKIQTLQERINKIVNEDLPDAQNQLTEDQAKQGEPIKSGSSKTSSMDSEAKKLGSSFLSGLAQEFGLDGLFGKSPAEWGITKLFGGLAKWGLGELNALGDAGGRIGGDAKPQGMGQNFLAGMAGSAGIPGFNLAAQAPAPQFPGGPNTAYDGGTPGAAPGPAQTPAQTPGVVLGPDGKVDYHATYPQQKPAGFTKQTPAGAPGSIVPPAPRPGAAPTGKVLPAADTHGPNLFGNRYGAGFDDGHGGRMPAPQGSPWASAASSLTTMALGFASKMIPNAGSMGGKGGQPAGFQVGSGGSSVQTAGGGDGGQGQPMGATGIMQGYGSVPTSYQGGGGDTHNYHAPINQTNYNIAPATDAQTMQSVQQHQNAQRSNAALASAPGSLQSYP
jgi:hypothetical protein